ncbi:MAG: hypothetical protein ACRBEE_09405 [Arenicella sp.]
MKLNSEKYDQASFSHGRVILCMWWLRSRSYVPNALRVSYKDMLFVWLEHNFSEQTSSIKRTCHRVIAKLRKAKG